MLSDCHRRSGQSSDDVSGMVWYGMHRVGSERMVMEKKCLNVRDSRRDAPGDRHCLMRG